jgi:hypothetical protein
LFTIHLVWFKIGLWCSLSVLSWSSSLFFRFFFGYYLEVDCSFLTLLGKLCCIRFLSQLFCSFLSTCTATTHLDLVSRMVVLIALLSGQVASFILFQPLGEAVLASTSLGMAVPALIPFRMIVASTICPLGIVALALLLLGMGMVAPALLLLGVVIQALTPILVAVLASMAMRMIQYSTHCGRGSFDSPWRDTSSHWASLLAFF